MSDILDGTNPNNSNDTVNPESGSTLLSDHIKAEPAVNPAVVASTPKESAFSEGQIDAEEFKVSAQTDKPAPFPIPSGPVDAEGTPFDPALHYTNDDGTPKVYPNGKLRRKRGSGSMGIGTANSGNNGGSGRNPEGVSTPNGGSGGNHRATPLLPSGVTYAQCKSFADLCVTGFQLAASSIFGEHWNPQTVEIEGQKVKDDRDLRQAVTDYCVENGIVSLPSWVPLVIAFGAYSIPRIKHPDTQSKINEWIGKKPQTP